MTYYLSFSEIRQTSFDYHEGLDLMSKDLKSAREKIKASLLNLSKLHLSKPAFDWYFDAKSDEILSIFLVVQV
jgi:hypothetical protein